MDEGSRRKTLGFGSARIVAALIVACSTLSGCLGPGAVQTTRMRYNQVVRNTNDEQLLINLVRLRYADSPVFIDLPNITSQFEIAGGASYPGKAGSQTAFGVAGLTGRDTPTLSYHPREGREIAKSLLTPMSADLFSVVNAGADVEQLCLLTINDINDVSNAPHATILVPKSADDNSLFLRGVQLLSQLRDREGTELGVGTFEESQTASDSIPTSKLDASDILAAARDAYVFRGQPNGESRLFKREKELVLRVRPAFVNSPEMLEIARIFHLRPGLSRYRIRSELTEEANRQLPNPLGDETLYLNMRSIMHTMMFMSKGVCVPEEHIVSGVAPTTLGPDGQPFDWTQITAGNFLVHVQKHRPHHSEVAVPYRGYWFYIPENDVNSRASLSILELLFALQESDGKSVAPLLTLPLGGG